jgi:RNA polymerase sigma-70 factor (ECF subfamily)
LRVELEEAVARAVTGLPEGLREVLILAHYEQMAIAEIAQVMEIEATTVKSRLQRARAELRETLAAYATSQERRS